MYPTTPRQTGRVPARAARDAWFFDEVVEHLEAQARREPDQHAARTVVVEENQLTRQEFLRQLAALLMARVMMDRRAT
jgi:hypothetical protein